MKRFACMFLLSAWPVSLLAQQPAAPPPAFAPPNLSPAGVRSMAANCAPCHGTGGKSLKGAPFAPLAGYPKDQFIATLKDFRDGKRTATIMQQIAKGYGDDEIAALADYFSAQTR